MSIKINKLEIENVKRVKAVKIEPSVILFRCIQRREVNHEVMGTSWQKSKISFK